MMGKCLRAALPAALLMLAIPGAQAASAVYPVLSLSISPTDVSLPASPYYQYVSFNGTAELDNPSGVPVTVSLFSRITEGWYAACQPNILNYLGSDSMPFNLTIRVSAGACNKTVMAWVEGEARINGALVSTNRSQQLTIMLGDLPGYTTSQNQDHPWLASTFGGNLALSPATALLTAIVLILAFAGLGLARRRRKRREARR